ncbi:MAG: ankyrin repeat domain-containing protein [Candidatus Babeliales bacterium]|jgi:ankyrin repeat protein
MNTFMKRSASIFLAAASICVSGYGMPKLPSLKQLNAKMLQTAILADDDRGIDYWLFDRSPNEIDLDWQDTDGNTALIHAARMGNLDIATGILEREAHINIQNNLGNTALIEAASRGDTFMVALLLQAAANAGMVNNKGQSALDVARAGGHDDVVALLENLVTDRNEIQAIASQEWQELPLEVLGAVIMPFVE